MNKVERINKIPKEEIKKELEETRELMLNSLPEKLAQIEVTKDEIKKLRNQNLHKNEVEFKESVEMYHIGKKLTAILQDRNIVMQIDQALEHLEYCESYLKE